MIKNLIARYKELETRSDRINQQNIEYKKTLEQLQKDTIWKSKVQEKIDELEAMSISQDIYYDDIKRLFQELLED